MPVVPGSVPVVPLVRRPVQVLLDGVRGGVTAGEVP
jgi:hypothetical protein